MGPQKSLYAGWMPGHPTLFLKREVYEKYGCYNDAYKIAVWFDIPLIVCKYRNNQRTGRARVPTETVESMYNRASRPSKRDFDEVWTIDMEGKEYK